jgi:hypothetical protein
MLFGVDAHVIVEQQRPLLVPAPQASHMNVRALIVAWALPEVALC